MESRPLEMIYMELEYVLHCIYTEDGSEAIFLPKLDELNHFPATEISNDAIESNHLIY